MVTRRRRLLILVLGLSPMLGVAPVWGEDLIPFSFQEKRELPPDKRPPLHTQCEFPNLMLPKSFVVYATGGYSGKRQNFQIDQSGHQATQFDVAVNEPQKPVVLILGAYEPSVWNIGWSPGTKIIAVLASGYHKQVIAGIGG